AFVVLTTGRCSDKGFLPIDDSSACKSAAAFLGYELRSAEPGGCRCVADDLCICEDPQAADGVSTTSTTFSPVEFVTLTRSTCAEEGFLPILDASACSSAATSMGFLVA
ncbi:unnamed protein product, partial [Polarella glacialis]